MQIYLLPALQLCSKSSMENRLPHLPCSVVVLCDPDVYRGICLPVNCLPDRPHNPVYLVSVDDKNDPPVASVAVRCGAA